MLTQIYEISTPKEAQSISKIGVDHIGVLAGNGEFPRELSLDAASRVAAAILPPSKLSLLFLTANLSLITNWAGQLDPAIVHLGAAPELRGGPRTCDSWSRVLRCSPAGFDVGSDRSRRDGWFDQSAFYLINTKSFVGCGAVGMWAKASISPLSEFAREAGEAQSVGNADRPHIHRPSW